MKPLSILDPSFVYTPSSRTDITKRFKSTGWSPPRQKYNPDYNKLVMLARDVAYNTEKYGDLPSALRDAALVALEPNDADPQWIE